MTIAYLSLNERSIREIAAIFLDKCKQDQSKPRDAMKTNRETPILILDRTGQDIVSLVATSGLPLTVDHYEKLFPELKIGKRLKALVSKKVLTLKGRLLYANQTAVKPLTDDKEHRKALHLRWVETLEPLRYYKDLAPYLAYHYIRLRRFDDAIVLLSEVAAGVELGHYNQMYIEALEALLSAQKLRSESKLEALNALGICLSRTRQLDRALAVFARLRVASRRLKNGFWLGQSFINAGVACVKSGKREAAQSWYRRAYQHGNRRKDWRLAGRALGNLAELEREQNLGTAKELLSRSISLKRRAGDRDGLASAVMQRANIEAAEGKFASASKSFRVALRQSRKADHPYAEALILHNLGRCCTDMRDSRQALRHFRRSYAVATELGDADTQMLAAVGEGVTCFNLQRFAEAVIAFEKLLVAATSLDDAENTMCALHGLAVSESILKKTASGKRRLTRAIRLARDQESSRWLVRCLEDGCRDLTNSPNAVIDEKQLERVAIQESRRSEFNVAAVLWKDLAAMRVSGGGSHENIFNAFERAAQCAGRDSLDPREHWILLTEVFG